MAQLANPGSVGKWPLK